MNLLENQKTSLVIFHLLRRVPLAASVYRQTESLLCVNGNVKQKKKLISDLRVIHCLVLLFYNS